MSFKLFSLMLSMITLSSFACEPAKKIQLANRDALKFRLIYYGGIGRYFADNDNFIDALAEKEITRDQALNIVTEHVDRDIANSSNANKKAKTQIARHSWINYLTKVTCDEYHEADKTSRLKSIMMGY